ncbi:MAG: ATP-binding protein [Chlamydiae bacterium]|nr:ATP-binding protein [Chlamydiota bacterium]MBI3266266.1 ATP-binding protein [Chlamydiota bacterium]
MKLRSISKALIESSRHYPVISLTGPRQSGKTTLVKSLFPNHEYVLLENPVDREFALSDPKGFLNRYSKGVIIDEAQRVPDLFSYIQGIVDQRQKPGQFILTGSQNFLLLEAIGQSLAGRVSIHHLMPFTLSELQDDPEHHFFNRNDLKLLESSKKDDLYEILFSGLYPRIHDQHLEPREWIGNYIQTYLERDVRSVINIGDLESYRRFFSLCAGRCGQILDQASLANDGAVSHTTVGRWLSILEASFQIITLRPYFKNFNKRIIKRPKLYFTDTGLLCYLLGIRSPEEIVTHPLKGALFENFIVADLFKTINHHQLSSKLYYWRESNKLEIDILIEDGLNIDAYEIKASETFDGRYVEQVDKFRSISQDIRLRNCGVFYAGDESFQYKNHRIISWRHV